MLSSLAIDIFKLTYGPVKGYVSVFNSRVNASHMWCCWLAPYVRTAK